MLSSLHGLRERWSAWWQRKWGGIQQTHVHGGNINNPLHALPTPEVSWAPLSHPTLQKHQHWGLLMINTLYLYVSCWVISSLNRKGYVACINTDTLELQLELQINVMTVYYANMKVFYKGYIGNYIQCYKHCITMQSLSTVSTEQLHCRLTAEPQSANW